MKNVPITKDQATKVIENYLKKNVPVLSFSVKPLSNQLDGLLGEQYFLTIQYQTENGTKDQRFFLKTVLDSNTAMLRIGEEMQVVEKERIFYNEIVPKMKSCGLDIDFIAEKYLCESSIIVLEDLSLSGFKVYGKNKQLDVNHCKICLKTIAKFHANGLLYQLIKSKESPSYSIKNEYPILKKNLFQEGSLLMRYFINSAKGIVELAKLLPQNGFDVDKFQTKFLTALENLEKEKGNFKLTISHNDLWGNNFLYRYSDDNEIKCKIIDYQTITLTPPSYDVMTFLFLNSRKEFRDEYLNEFLKYYYNCLSKNIEEKGFVSQEVLSEEEFYASCDAFTLHAKLHSIIDRSTTLIPEETYLKANQSKEDAEDFFFEGRFKYMLEAFATDDKYKDIMIEDIKELSALLFMT